MWRFEPTDWYLLHATTPLLVLQINLLQSRPNTHRHVGLRHIREQRQTFNHQNFQLCIRLRRLEILSLGQEQELVLAS